MLRVISRPAPPPPRAGRGARRRPRRAAPERSTLARFVRAGSATETAHSRPSFDDYRTVHGPCDICRFHQLAPLLYTVYSPSHRPTGKGNLGDKTGGTNEEALRVCPSPRTPGRSSPAGAFCSRRLWLSLSRARTQLSSVAYDGIGSCMRPVVCWPIRWLIRWEDTSP